VVIDLHAVAKVTHFDRTPALKQFFGKCFGQTCLNHTCKRTQRRTLILQNILIGIYICAIYDLQSDRCISALMRTSELGFTSATVCHLWLWVTVNLPLPFFYILLSAVSVLYASNSARHQSCAVTAVHFLILTSLASNRHESINNYRVVYAVTLRHYMLMCENNNYYYEKFLWRQGNFRPS